MTDTQNGWTEMRYRDIASHVESLREASNAFGQVALFFGRVKVNDSEEYMVTEALKRLSAAAWSVDAVALDLGYMTPEEDVRRGMWNKAAADLMADKDAS